MLELYQGTVQIRGCAYAIRLYFCDIDPAELIDLFNRYTVTLDQRKETALTLQFAYAARAKLAGAQVGTLDTSFFILI
ncbi:hypothetical protein DIJ64_07835 [Mycobacterium leprae]|uniref:Uncharacterized protein n=1 Tax=Mycobacterium leprae TaxID=1769 RepID=A0AAD0P7Z0_MYCLR|nr:hypothetical protein [Mycobacterium leprae]AWV48009.1 hypothetical protein DIJ64_07835 [Mycobacterium leprae]OAR19791.1 hypothetical protein A8144_03850 [Mycobacterium leprae 3125609]OAX71905.1 hypothetical protein A3216_02890 [Mycobacterium leprae 7935681]